MSLIITKAGLNVLAQAEQTGTKLKATHIAVGDGNGQAVAHTTESLGLVNETWRGALQKIEKTDVGEVEFEGHVPFSVGGWYIREVAIYADAVLLAIGSHPDVWKPIPEAPEKVELVITAPVKFDNAEIINLTVDTTKVLASQEHVAAEIAKHGADNDTHQDIRIKLNGKADSGHGHNIANISGLQGVLESKLSKKGSASQLSCATHESRGVVELATDAEAKTGKDSSRVITPASLEYALQHKPASADSRGLIELANSAEAEAGTDNARALSPLTASQFFAARLAGLQSNGAAALYAGKFDTLPRKTSMFSYRKEDIADAPADAPSRGLIITYGHQHADYALQMLMPGIDLHTDILFRSVVQGSATGRSWGAWNKLLTAKSGIVASINVVELKTSGIYKKPSNLLWAEVTLVGGGGGASRFPQGTSSIVPCGGGGAGTCVKTYMATDLNASEAYVIGAGGAGTSTGGQLGGTGGTSTFKGLVAKGGQGAGLPKNAVLKAKGGDPGSASGGDFNLMGMGGDSAKAYYYHTASGGCSAMFGGKIPSSHEDARGNIVHLAAPGKGGDVFISDSTVSSHMNGCNGELIIKEYLGV